MSLTVMERNAIFQIAVSIAASLCAGISFLVWISLIAKGDLTWFPLLSKKPTLLIQAGLGILILTGSLASLVLAIYRPVYKGDTSRPILIIAVGFLLLLPTIHEFLSLINQRFWGINVFIAFLIIKTFLLVTFFCDGISLRVRPILPLLILAFITLEVLFLGVQYFRLWIICARLNSLNSKESPRLDLNSQTFPYRRALKAVVSAAAALGSISAAITIIASVAQFLGIPLATLEVAILTFMKLVIPYFISREPQLLGRVDNFP